MHPEPTPGSPAWLAARAALVGPARLEVNGFDIDVQVDEPLAEACLDTVCFLRTRLERQSRRLIAGLAGIPGGGKSTFAALLRRAADLIPGPGRLAVIGLDGWHYPNAVLDARTISDEHGTRPLRSRKGGPESFDTRGLAEALDRLALDPGPVKLPAYDRRLHEPVPEALTIEPSVRILVLEGNFVLSSHGQWAEVSRRLSPKLFLICEPAQARERVIARHIRGGCTPEQAAAKFDSNDHLNTAVALATAASADRVITLD